MSSGTGWADDLLEEVLAEANLALPQRAFVGLPRVPPKLGAVRHKRTYARLAPLILVDQLDTGVKEPVHLVPQPRPITARAATVILHAQLAHELGQRGSQDQLAALGSYCFGAHPGQQQARHVAEGQPGFPTSSHDQAVRAVLTDIPKPVAGIGAGQ